MIISFVHSVVIIQNAVRPKIIVSFEYHFSFSVLNIEKLS